MQEGKKSGAGTVIYSNPDGTSHWRKGSWIDNDLRGEVEHYFSTNNRDGTSNLTKKVGRNSLCARNFWQNFREISLSR